tara:strand:+ start:372 stop:1889 length:1518 start_codon:yes stop_codon:yes gene_type:complete
MEFGIVNKKIFLTGLVLSIPSQLFAATIEVDENKLRSMTKKGSLHYDKIILSHSKAEAGIAQFNDQYAFGIKSETKYMESDEPRESPWIKTQSIGFGKKTAWGVEGSMAYVFRHEKLGNLFPALGEQNVAGKQVMFPFVLMRLKFDLWKNLLGSLDRSKEKNLQAMLSQSKINKSLKEKGYHIFVRTIYWRLVIHDERVRLHSQVVKLAKRTLKTMRARLRDNVADKSAVAGMTANLSQAEASLRTMKFQRNLIERQLKLYLPALLPYTIKVKDTYPGVVTAVKENIKCADMIGSKKSIPYSYTQYDDLMREIDNALYWKEKELDSYSEPTLSFSLTGRSFGFDKLTEDFIVKDGEEPEIESLIEKSFNDKQKAINGVLTLSYPLGQLDKTEKKLISNAKIANNIKRSEITARFLSAHSNVQKSIPYLKEAISMSHQSIRDLKGAFKLTQRKLNQGRISVFDYTRSQRNLLNAQIQVLGLEEKLIMEMLEYFTVYDQAPCSFNRN